MTEKPRESAFGAATRIIAADDGRVSPTMAAGISDRLWSPEDGLAKIDEMAGPRNPRGPYEKRPA